MIRIVLMAMWLGFAITSFGQTQPNPFDLQYRPRHIVQSSTPVKPKSEIDSSVYKTPVTKPIEAPSPGQLNKTGIDTSSNKIHKDSSVSKTTNNPFEMGKGKGAMDSTSGSVNKAEEKAADEVKVIPPIISIKKTGKGIQVFFILLSLLFLIFIVNVERSFVRDLWRVISNENYSSLHLRNQRNTMRQILLVMGYSIFIFQAGIFLFHVMTIFGLQSRFLVNIWACIGLILMIYLARHGFIRYLRWLFNNDKEMTLFGFDISIFNVMVGLVLLPVNIVLNFGPENLAKPLIIIGLLAIGVAYVMRQLRWMFTARHLISNSLFLFFVYLCAVEILPLWAISKFFW